MFLHYLLYCAGDWDCSYLSLNVYAMYAYVGCIGLIVAYDGIMSN